MKNRSETNCILSKRTPKRKYPAMQIKGKFFLEHRKVYEDKFGEIPLGKIIRHKCDNSRCINVNHLEIGIHKDNVRDRVVRKRSATGIKNGRSKLTEKQVKYILQSNKPKKYLARKFKVDPNLIRKIKKKKVWKDVL